MTNPKFKCLVFNSSNLQSTTIDALQDNFEILYEASPDRLNTIFNEVYFAFISPGFYFSSSFLDSLPNLKYVATNATSLLHLDFESFQERKIQIFSLENKPYFLSSITPTSEHALALALLLTRNIIPAYQTTLSGQWNRNLHIAPKMFSRFRVGVIGLGRLGTKFANYCNALGAKVYYTDPEVYNNSYERLDLEMLMDEVDLISIHATPSNNFPLYLDGHFLRKMKKESFLINTARAEFLDHHCLLHMLENKLIAGAALDVLPYEYGHALENTGISKKLLQYAARNHNLIITPHIGGSTKDAREDTEMHVARCLIERAEQFG